MNKLASEMLLIFIDSLLFKCWIHDRAGNLLHDFFVTKFIEWMTNQSAQQIILLYGTTVIQTDSLLLFS